MAEVIRDAVEVYLSLLKARDRNVRLYFEDKRAANRAGFGSCPALLPSDFAAATHSGYCTHIFRA